MNFRCSAWIFGVIFLLASGEMSISPVLAMNPSFAHTLILPPGQGRSLFSSYLYNVSVFQRFSPAQKSAAVYWSPTNAEVAQAEDDLSAVAAAPDVVIDPKLDQFLPAPRSIVLTTDLREYTGITVDTKRYILVAGSTAYPNFVAGVMPALTWDGQTQTDGPTDGGSAFQAVFNSSTKHTEFLVFNHFMARRYGMVLL